MMHACMDKAGVDLREGLNMINTVVHVSLKLGAVPQKLYRVYKLTAI